MAYRKAWASATCSTPGTLGLKLGDRREVKTRTRGETQQKALSPKGFSSMSNKGANKIFKVLLKNCSCPRKIFSAHHSCCGAFCQIKKIHQLSTPCEGAQYTSVPKTSQGCCRESSWEHMACIFPIKVIDWINMFWQHLQVRFHATLVKLSYLLCSPPTLLPGAAQMPSYLRLPPTCSLPGLKI